MTMITPSYLGETIEYSSLHACRSTLEDPTYCTRKAPLRGPSSESPKLSRRSPTRSISRRAGPWAIR